MSKIGHNEPPKTLEDFFIKDQNDKSTGRIKLTNTIIKKYLKPIPTEDGQGYIYQSVNDSEKIGLRCRLNPGGSIVWRYQYTPTGKLKNKKRFNTVYYTLGYFPAMSVDTARSLVEDLKHAIKLGQDPRTVLEERRKAKTLLEVVELWKEKDLFKSTRFAASTAKNTEQRLRNWISLKAYKASTNKVIAANYADLKIGFKKMVEITKSDLSAWHAAISKAGTYQANRTLDDMSIIFNWALEEKIIKENICKFKKSEKNEENDRLDDVDPYSIIEWRLIRKAAVKVIKEEPRVFLAAMAILLYLYCGRRYKSEILSLRWNQIDWDANKVRLPKTKTGKSQFSIHKMSRWVLRQLWKYNKENYKGKKAKTIKAAYLFPATKKSKKPYLQDIRKTWVKVCNIGGVRIEELVLLRHTWACLALIASNGNIKLVKDEGGWKTYKMVERYAKYNERHLQKQSEVIGSYLARAKA